MRIGFDAKRVFFNRSGLGNYGRNILSALFDYCPENDYLLFTPHADNHLFFNEKSQIITPHGFFSLFPSLWRYCRIGHDAKKHRLDIYHGLINELPRDIKSLKTKSIATIHDTIFMRYPHWYKWHDRLFYEQKTAFACKTADAIIAVSEQTKADLIHYFKAAEEKIRVIYQPCNAVFSTQITEQQKNEVKKKWHLPDTFILMVGNIEERKNIKLVIDAVQNQNITLPLVVVGRENRYAVELKQEILQKNIQNVHFCHNIFSLDLPAVYALASVFVYPSFFEGFGIPIVEALSCGVPVITSDTSCFRETGGEAVLYVNPNSKEEMVEAIYKVINDNTLRSELIQKGKFQIEKFRPEAIAKEIINLYLTI